MSKLPKLSGHETIKALSKLGFVKKRQRRSHVMLVKKTDRFVYRYTKKWLQER